VGERGPFEQDENQKGTAAVRGGEQAGLTLPRGGKVKKLQSKVKPKT